MKNVLQLVKKTIALTLTLSLVYSQLLWAADVRQMLLDAKAAFDLEDTRRGDGMSAGALETAQSTQQSQVEQQQALQDLQGMNFSLTTQNGDILTYVGNALKEVKRPDGTVLKNLVTDAQGLIQSADLKLSDGSIQVLRNGEVVAYELPDGTQVFYESGKIQKTVSPQGIETLYTYTYAADHSLEGIALENSQTRTLASHDGIIKQVLKKSDGSVTNFSSGGLIEKIVYSDGSALKFQTIPYGNDQKIVFHTYTDAQGAIFYEAPEGILSFEYFINRADGSLKEALLSDGQKLKFSAQGTLTEAIDSYGHAVTISFQESALSNILGTQIVQGGLESHYNAKGDLESIRFGELTLYYKDSALDYAKLDDGTILKNLLFDAAGNLSSANVTTPDGEERVYQNGKLTELKKPDETKLFYFDDKITELLTPQGLTYEFNYEPQSIQATLNSVGTPDALTPIRMEYDGSFNLKKIILQNAEILNYLNDRLINSVSQNGSQTYYDDAGNILKTVIPSTPGNPHTLEVLYQYGKIRQILKDSVLTFKYTYSFDASGAEVTTIQDLEEKAFKTYKDGLLLTSLSTETSVLSTYFYESVIASEATQSLNNRVVRVQVTRFSRTLHTYMYVYEGSRTIVTDEEGVKRTYSDVQKLLFLEKEGKKFSYEYWAGADGKEIVEEKLIEMALPGSTKAYFTDGNVNRIEFSDGTVLENIVVQDGVLKEATANLADGRKLLIDPSGVKEELYPDGTKFTFINNVLQSVEDPKLGKLSYSEERDTAGNLLAVWVTKNNYLLKYNPTGNLLGIKLPGVLTPKEVFEKATHVATGGSNPTYGYDGNLNTAQVGGLTTLKSEHTFQTPQVITSITYRLSANSWSNGSTDNGSSAETYIETKDATTGLWTKVSGTQLNQSHNNSGGGGSTAVADTTNPATKTITIQNVIGIRAYAWSSAFSNGGGGTGGSSAIWEISPVLSDQSFLNFNKTTNTFSDYKNSVVNMNSLFGNNLPSFTSTPYKEKIHNILPSQHETWIDVLGETAVNSELVTIQEYSSQGALEVQKKADRTYTIFENNKPKMVLNEGGESLIEYTYDADGYPVKVYLKRARESLPKEIAKARLKIEEDRAKALRELAAQKNLAYNTIYAQAKTQKDLLNINLNDIQNQYNSVSSQGVHGSAARSQKAGALGQIQTSIDQVMGYLSSVNKSEADSYAALDTQVKALSDQINTDANTAFTGLAAQETVLKREILRQEVSPIIFDHYRRILGRDPSVSEYDSWISKLNYDTGMLLIGENIEERLKPGGSVYLDGNGDYLSLSDSDDWNFAAGNFTIDFWTKFNDLSTAQVIIGQRQDVSNRWFLSSQSAPYNRLRFLWVYKGVTVAEYILTNPPGFTTLDFYHIALQRSGSSVKIFINGSEQAVTATKSIYSGSLGDIQAPLIIGQQYSANYLDGYVDELRISKGVARFSMNFTPSKTIYQSDSYTKLLLRSEPGSATPFKDESALNKAISAYGNARQELTQFVTQEKYTVKTPAYGQFIPTLQSFVNALPELSERTAYVNSIKSKIVQKINSYILMSDLQKGSFAASLGLAQSDLVPLSNSDAQKILAWLGSRALHFGQSAFLSLEALLDQKGISYAREDIAERSILIDVLSGVISPLDDGDLVISMFALNKVAQSYGLSLSGANLTFEDLLAIYQSTPTAKIIAHVNGNHYVVIQSVTANSITYVDTGRGKDKQNEVMTLSKDDFLKGWKGVVTLEAAKLQSVSGYSSKMLSVEQTQKIRGSFFFLLIPAIIGAVSQIGVAVWAVLNGIGTILAVVGQLVGSIVTNISYAMNSLGQGLSYIGESLYGGIKFAASSIFGQQGFFATFANQSFFGSAAQASFGEQIFQNAVSIGVKFAVSRGLEALGVNPVITNLVSSFATGGVVGGFQAGFSSVNLIQGGIKALALTGTQGLLESAGLDTNLASVLSLASGQFVSGILHGNLGGQIIKISQSLGTNLSMYGIEKLGVSLGVDSRIVTLAGIPITSTIGAFGKAGDFTQNIITGIKDGITRGIAGVAFEYINQRAGLSPLVGAMIDLGLTGALEGILEGQGLFKGAFDSYFNATNGLLTFGGQGATEYDRVIYLSKVLDFSRIAKDQGIGNAINSYATSIFSRQSLENIWKAGGIYDLLVHNAEIVTNDEGVTVKRLYLDKTDKAHSEYIDISLADDQLLGYKEIRLGATVITDCVYEVGPDGRVVAKDEKKRILFDDGRKEVYLVKDHYLISIEKIDANGKTVAWITPSESNKGIEVNSNDTIKSGKIYNFKEGWVVEIKDNEISKSIILDSSNLTDPQISDFVKNGTSSSYLASVRMIVSNDNGFIKVETIPGSDISSILEGSRPKISLISGNGIDNPNSEWVPPDYEAAYRDILAQRGISKNSIYLLPLYENGNVFQDTAEWIYDAFTSQGLTQEIIAKYDANINLLSDNDKNTPKTAVLYSGSFNPFMMALGLRHDYNVGTVVSLGGPSIIGTVIPGQISNPNLKRIVNIYGSNDGVLFAGKNKMFRGAEVININILGATHLDYFYKLGGSAVNDKSSLFVEKITNNLLTKNETEFYNLLHGAGVTYDETTQAYIVDLSNAQFQTHAAN